jgi:hypothetical protein
MARSQQIELKFGQALSFCSHLGKLEIGGLADELEFEHGLKRPKVGGRQMGQILSLWDTLSTQEREGTSGQDAYGSLNQAAKRRQTIIPDLVTSHHPADSIIHANGPQMWEFKRVHSAQAFSRDSRLPDGLNDFYHLRNRGRMVRAADRRADLVPSEYEAKANRQMRHLAPREARQSSERSGLSPRCEEPP